MNRQMVEDKWFDIDHATVFNEDCTNDPLSQFSQCHQQLFKTAKGSWVQHIWVEPSEFTKEIAKKHSWSDWKRSEEWRFIKETEAYAWLLKNNHHKKFSKEFEA